MRYRVELVNPETGESSYPIIEAASRVDAKAQASQWGGAVGQAVPIDPEPIKRSQPPASPPITAEQLDMILKNRLKSINTVARLILLQFWLTVILVLGLISLGVAAWILKDQGVNI